LEEDDEDSTGPPRVRLPAVTAGVLNAAAVKKLQDELESTKGKLMQLEGCVSVHMVEGIYGGLRNRPGNIEDEQSLNVVSVEANRKMDEEIEATVKSRLRGVYSEFKRDFDQAKEAMKASFWNDEMTVDQARDLIEKNPTVAATVKKMVEAQLAQQMAGLGESLTDIQARELYETNSKLRSVLVANLNTRVTQAMEKFALEIKSEYEAKIEASEERIAEGLQKLMDEEIARIQAEHAQDIEALTKRAESAKAHAISIAEKKSSLKVNMSEVRCKSASAKLEILERAARETPKMTVKEVWEQIRSTQLSPTTPLTSLPSPIPAPVPAPPNALTGATQTPPSKVRELPYRRDWGSSIEGREEYVKYQKDLLRQGVMPKGHLLSKSRRFLEGNPFGFEGHRDEHGVLRSYTSGYVNPRESAKPTSSFAIDGATEIGGTKRSRDTDETDISEQASKERRAHDRTEEIERNRPRRNQR
jgi:hypothetical protein